MTRERIGMWVTILDRPTRLERLNEDNGERVIVRYVANNPPGQRWAWERKYSDSPAQGTARARSLAFAAATDSAPTAPTKEVRKRASGPSGKHLNPVLRISGVTPEERDALYAHAADRGGFAVWARGALAKTMRRESAAEARKK